MRARSRLRRRRPLAALACALALAPMTARATPKRTGKGGDYGLGASLGDPTGVTFKAFFHARHALESGLGFGPFHLGGGRVHATYLFHSKPWQRDDGFFLHGYVGLGVGLGFWHKHFVGPLVPDHFHSVAMFVRAPVLGLAFHLQNVPVDVYLETAYSPIVAPPTSFWNVDFALGARYWF